MTDKSPTIIVMGCGIAGSWAAHHLCSIGYAKFRLFGGAAVYKSLTDLGPACSAYYKGQGQTTAELLQDHLLALSPAVQIETVGNFDPNKHASLLDSPTIGTMGSMPGCMSAYQIVKSKGHIWMSLGLPSNSNGQAVIVDDPHDLDPDEHLGEPNLTRAQVMLIGARFAKAFASRL